MDAAHRVKRLARTAALTVAGPVDWAALLLNGKRGYPPIALRRQNGPLNTFERVAGEYVAYLTTLAGLSPDSHVLDVGCGSGAMAIMLRERLGPNGRYTGFEVDRPTVTWCQRNLADDRFRFFHHDYWNATYNPGGQRELRWPVGDDSVDVILLKSIFTHMLPDDVAFYLSEIRRVLRPSGTALVTAFLYDDAAGAVRGRHSFPHEGDGYRFSNPASPESAIALDAPRFDMAVSEAGLKADVLPGLWRATATARPYAYQDMVLLSRT